MGNDPQVATVAPGSADDAEGSVLQGIWREVAAGNAGATGATPATDPARGEPLSPLPPNEGTRPSVQADAAPGPASDATQPGDPEHGRLLQSARAVQALNERLQVDMDVPGHRLARDRLTAFVAKVSALSGVRPDELVIGSGSDAFVVQNDAGGRTIAKFDTQDAIKAPVGDSLDRLATLSREQQSQAANEQAIEQPQRTPLLP